MKKIISTLAIVAVIAAPAFAGQGNPQKRLQRLTTELHLNAAQQQQIESIVQQQKRQHDALREQYDPQDEQLRTEMRALRKRGASDIDALLTPEQQTAFAELRAQHRAKRLQQQGKSHHGQGSGDSHNQ